MNQLTNAFFPYFQVYCSLLLVAILYFKSENKYYYVLGIYILLVISILIFREKQDNKEINFSFYLDDWIRIVFSNKTVFLNVIGNLLIFTPFVLILKNLKFSIITSFLLTIFLIFLFEFLQYITKRGVFDIVDIYLNSIGVLLLTAIRAAKEVKRYEKKKA